MLAKNPNKKKSSKKIIRRLKLKGFSSKITKAGCGGEKILHATESIQKSTSTGELKLWMRVIVGVIVIIMSASAVILYKQLKSGDIKLNMLTVSDTEADTQSDTSSDDIDTEGSLSYEEELLFYVNSKHPIDIDYKPELVKYDELYISPYMQEDLTNMLKAAENDGVSLEIYEAYVSCEEQQKKYEAQLAEYKKQGYSDVRAQAETMKVIPDGKSGEHRTGLNITLKSDGEEDFSLSDEFNWMKKNGIEYGFIQRYTEYSQPYTGMTVSYTEFRYVGKENAKKMRSLDMCLEQYSDYFNNR